VDELTDVISLWLACAGRMSCAEWGQVLRTPVGITDGHVSATANVSSGHARRMSRLPFSEDTGTKCRLGADSARIATSAAQRESAPRTSELQWPPHGVMKRCGAGPCE
jgi:hypothetical protein